MLWIAFKFVSLQEIWQLTPTAFAQRHRCELLSNLYLCRRFGNHKEHRVESGLVVNCFQICIFAGDLATHGENVLWRRVLWIAFKFVSLQEIWQRLEPLFLFLPCCELLSNLYLCRRFGNHPKMNAPATKVVNCFQICIFAGDLATAVLREQATYQLWIAFKFVSLQEIWQLCFRISI